MASLRIVDLKVYVLDEPQQRSFRWRHGLPGAPKRNETCWLQIVTDEGIDGWSLGGQGAIVADLVQRRLRDLLVGRDPLMREEIWHEFWEVDRIELFPTYLTGLVDVALWDIAGKLSDLPLYRLLGGARTRIAAYASTVTWETVDDYLRQADACLEIGYSAIKLHAWGDVTRDAELARALRRHVGDAVPLMYDGSAGFRYEEALRLGRVLEECGFLWYEEPMREYAVAPYAKLCSKLDIPILAPEIAGGAHWNAASFVTAGATDLLRTGVDLRGGVTGAMRIAHFADCLGMYAEVHGDGLPNLHLACAIPNTRYLEIIVVDDPAAERNEAGELGIDKDGYVTVPERAGVGWTVSAEELLRHPALVSTA